MNSDFEELTGAIFPYLKYEKAVGDYIIVRYGKGERLYSLIEREYTEIEFSQIDYSNGIFICKDTDETSVFDSNLNLITKCNDATFTENILMVLKDDRYFYYTKDIV